MGLGIRQIKRSRRTRQTRPLPPEGSRPVRWRATRRGRAVDEPVSTIQHVLFLRRVDPDTNVARFYALMIERDLFGRVVLVRRWGRIGTRGRERSDSHENEAAAAEAMAKLAAVKRRRGYQDL